MLERALIALLATVALSLAGCGDDGGGDPADANGADDDGSVAVTSCPPTDDLMCDTATQMCVVSGPFGPTNTSDCESVPAGCENDRTCACAADTLCPSPTDTCTETADNTIYCDNGTQ